MEEKWYLLAASSMWTCQTTFNDPNHWKYIEDWSVVQQLMEVMDRQPIGHFQVPRGNTLIEPEETASSQMSRDMNLEKCSEDGLSGYKASHDAYFISPDMNSKKSVDDAQAAFKVNEESRWWLPGWLEVSASLEKQMNQEKKERERYTCTICDRQFQFLYHFKAHCEKHTEDNHNHRTHTNEKRYSCRVCKKTFPHSKAFKLHIQSHTEEQLTCAVCGKTYSGKTNLRHHVRNVHESKERFTCSRCAESFVWRSNLERHNCVTAADVLNGVSDDDSVRI